MKEFFMRKKMALVGIIGVLAVFGLILASCDPGNSSDDSSNNNNNNDNGGNNETPAAVVPSALIGRWSTMENDLNATYLAFEFTANEFKLGDASQILRFTGKKCERQSADGWILVFDNYLVTGTKLVISKGANQEEYYKVP
jgi:hypothetical protein